MLTKAKARKLISLVPYAVGRKRRYAVRLSIGCQSFNLDMAGDRTKAEAAWFADQFAMALSNLK